MTDWEIDDEDDGGINIIILSDTDWMKARGGSVGAAVD